MDDLISRSTLIKKLKEKSTVDGVNIISTTYTYKELVHLICNMDNSELKSCPFCGGKAELIEKKHREYPSTYYVICKGCHCKSQENISECVVTVAWNKRTLI